ncbi:hypothetical protein EVAR_43787_1 [Eumeta japonica]|uniref:Uncharacterized protein n=1 Tax=Eumeta variegata TaxID=151549 RepID=A0A4C1XTI4_EUMVA|nr:hypothetical protein EVAR_43787_1 [Eumeta japonica]
MRGIEPAPRAPRPPPRLTRRLRRPFAPRAHFAVLLKLYLDRVMALRLVVGGDVGGDGVGGVAKHSVYIHYEIFSLFDAKETIKVKRFRVVRTVCRCKVSGVHRPHFGRQLRIRKRSG